jgi:hypothetical protein
MTAKLSTGYVGVRLQDCKTQWDFEDEEETPVEDPCPTAGIRSRISNMPHELMSDPVSLLFEGIGIFKELFVFPEPAGLGNLEVLRDGVQSH